MGRVIRVGPADSNGVLLCYGDYALNPDTGIDVISVSPSGVTTTLFEAFNTEQITHYRVLNGGHVWAPAIDPRGSSTASAVTNYGGTWHTITVSVDGLPVAAHLFDLDQEENGDLLAVGSRDPDTAFVWRSENYGANWAEELHDDTDLGGYNRFFSLRRSGGLPVVTKGDNTGYYVLRDGLWEMTDHVTFDDPRTIYVDPSQHLIHHVAGDLGALPTPTVLWSASLAPDGRIWLSDGASLYLLPPPD